MSIRYYIDLPCQPREDLGAEELLRLVLLRERATTLRSRFVEKGVTDPEAMKFRERVVTTSGEETRERSVANLLEESRVLDEVASWCGECPARLVPAAFGCIWQVSLPISNGAQCWLLEQLPEEGTKGLELFREAVQLFRYGTEGPLSAWRKAGFLEGATAPELERGDFKANADMILTELFLVGNVMPSHALGLLLHLRALKTSDGRDGDALIELIDSMNSSGSAEDAPTIDFVLTPSEDDDRSTRELKQFLAACYLGLELQVPVTIHL
ncbi:hypothetical protein GC173_00745 [bacterium]|nr:hypothetical protein [bacterium]